MKILDYILVGRILAYPMRLRRERVRSLAEASDPNAPINHVPGTE